MCEDLIINDQFLQSITRNCRNAWNHGRGQSIQAHPGEIQPFVVLPHRTKHIHTCLLLVLFPGKKAWLQNLLLSFAGYLFSILLSHRF